MASKPVIYENTTTSLEHIYMNTQSIQRGASLPAAPAAALPSVPAPIAAIEEEAGYVVMRGVNRPAQPEPVSRQSSVPSVPSIPLSRSVSEAGVQTIVLTRGPRGFGLVLTGGKDTPAGLASVSHVAADGPGNSVVMLGDIVNEINGISLRDMTHAAILETMRVQSALPSLVLIIERRAMKPEQTEVYTEVPMLPMAPRTQSVDTRPYTAKTAPKPAAAVQAPRSPYVAKVTREEADEILATRTIGSFLIRPSTTQPNQFVLAVKTAGGVEHVGPLGVGEAGLSDLVDRHKRSLDGLPTLLRQCFATPQNPF